MFNNNTIENICFENVDTSNFEDNKEFIIVKYLKNKDGIWQEIEKFKNGNNWHIIKGKICIKSKLEKGLFIIANMDFNNTIDNACYQIVNN